MKQHTCFSNHLLLELNEQSMAFLDPDVVVNPVKEEFALLLLAEFSISLMLSSLALDMAGLFKPFILVSSVSIATF